MCASPFNRVAALRACAGRRPPLADRRRANASGSRRPAVCRAGAAGTAGGPTGRPDHVDRSRLEPLVRSPLLLARRRLAGLRLVPRARREHGGPGGARRVPGVSASTVVRSRHPDARRWPCHQRLHRSARRETVGWTVERVHIQAVRPCSSTTPRTKSNAASRRCGPRRSTSRPDLAASPSNRPTGHRRPSAKGPSRWFTPAASRPDRRWPAECFSAVAAMLAARIGCVALTGSRYERAGDSVGARRSRWRGAPPGRRPRRSDTSRHARRSCWPGRPSSSPTTRASLISPLPSARGPSRSSAAPHRRRWEPRGRVDGRRWRRRRLAPGRRRPRPPSTRCWRAVLTVTGVAPLR